jgi:hypothetical protein
MADLDKLEELAKVATRVAAYLDRRSRSSGLDKEEIHAFDVGPDGQGFYLRSSDLRTLVSQALARPDLLEALREARAALEQAKEDIETLLNGPWCEAEGSLEDWTQSIDQALAKINAVMGEAG